MKCPDKYRARIDALESVLTELLGGQAPAQVQVYACEDEKIGGLRIVEIDIVANNSGCCFQRAQYDSSVLGFILACEDYARYYDVKPYRPPGWQSVIDEAGDAHDKLKTLIQELL